MNNKGIEEIERIMEMYSDDVFVSGHIEEKYINEVEEEIGLKFPKEYREYVEKFGSGGLGSVDILGIDMGIINMGLEVSVLEYLERWRGRGLEEKYIPVYHLDDIAIVVDGTDENSPVYSYYWGVGIPGIQKSYDSFFEFVLDYMQEWIDNEYDEDEE